MTDHAAELRLIQAALERDEEGDDPPPPLPLT